MDAPAVQVTDVVVDYGGLSALDSVNVAVNRGTTVGVLGHNGAGKTTLIRVLATLIRPRQRARADRRDRRRGPIG